MWDIYTHTHPHTHTHIYIYIYIQCVYIYIHILFGGVAKKMLGVLGDMGGSLFLLWKVQI